MAMTETPVLIETSEAHLSFWRFLALSRLLAQLKTFQRRHVTEFLAKYGSLFEQDDEASLSALFDACSEFLAQLDDTDPVREICARVAYACYRRKDRVWHDLSHWLRRRLNGSEISFPQEFSFSDESFGEIPSVIRQCRPDRVPYGVDELEQVGLLSHNRHAAYRCYDGAAARLYLATHFGRDVCELFDTLRLPQAESEFFMVASLLKEGGISVDVASVGKAPLAPVIRQIHGLGLVTHDGWLEKKFLAALPGNPIIRRYFERILAYLSYCRDCGESPEYRYTASREVLEAFILDSFCDGSVELSSRTVTLISSKIYNTFVEGSCDEENLAHSDDGARFRRSSMVGVASPSLIPTGVRATRVLARMPGAYCAPGTNVRVVGEDRIPWIAEQVRLPVALPPPAIYQVYNMGLSGHGCCWLNGRFMRLDSYLSWVAENEALAGHWRIPGDGGEVRVIEEPAIVSFGAGYGCYGHYLVDDLPRLAIAKHLLGEREFLRRKVVVPQKTPSWAINVLKVLGGVPEENLLFFDHEKEYVEIRDGIVPSYPHRHYRFHPCVAEGYRRLSPKDAHPHRRICLSRKAWEKTKSGQRVFEQQELFEAMAVERGFELIAPETMSLPDQIRLLAETRCMIGEHGSAQHASVYNRYGMTVGAINPLTEVQTNLGRICGDRNVITWADSERRENNNIFYSLTPEKIEQFFSAVEEEDRARVYSFD